MSKTLVDKINELMPPWKQTEPTLWHPTMPAQSMGEWQAYLEFIDAYFRNRGIKKPMIVEIGIGYGKQRQFYEEILGYDYIGIDVRAVRSKSTVRTSNPALSRPDIVGNSRSPGTLKKLIKKLGGRPVNLVYLDGEHTYAALKQDFHIYAPLAKNIIAIHDVTLKVLQSKTGRFWKELMVNAAKRKAQDRTYITLTGYYTIKYDHEHSFGQGTGLILKEDMSR